MSGSMPRPELINCRGRRCSRLCSAARTTPVSLDRSRSFASDRTSTRSQSGAQVPQGTGPEVPAGPYGPRAAQKNLAEHVEIQAQFLETDLRPCLDAAVAGQGHVFFVDAAHFVFGTFLC